MAPNWSSCSVLIGAGTTNVMDSMTVGSILGVESSFVLMLSLETKYLTLRGRACILCVIEVKAKASSGSGSADPNPNLLFSIWMNSIFNFGAHNVCMMCAASRKQNVFTMSRLSRSCSRTHCGGGSLFCPRGR